MKENLKKKKKIQWEEKKKITSLPSLSTFYLLSGACVRELQNQEL